ncbi:MAG: aminotransferase class V-fold PLP-dependent enzyme, partial [Acidimicrobiales bacterium]
MSALPHALPIALVGDGELVPCVDGVHRPYLNLDAAASTSALPAVARRVEDFLPTYASVHRGAGYRSRQATAAYEEARQSALAFAGRSDRDGDVAIFCRNTTEAINHLAYRLRLEPRDVVATTVIEHHANLLPWARLCDRRFVECGLDGTFGVEAVTAILD